MRASHEYRKGKIKTSGEGDWKYGNKKWLRNQWAVFFTRLKNWIHNWISQLLTSYLCWNLSHIILLCIFLLFWKGLRLSCYLRVTNALEIIVIDHFNELDFKKVHANDKLHFFLLNRFCFEVIEEYKTIY